MMMFASSGSGSGGGGFDDDDYVFDDDFDADDPTPPEEPSGRRPQSNRTRRNVTGRAAASGGRSRSASVQPEERYWTDYLRIALPVIGIILLLGLLWIWASSLLGDDDTDIQSTPEDTIGLVQTQPADPNEVNTEPQGVSTPAPEQNTNAGEIPIPGQTTPVATNPVFNPSATEPPVEGGDNAAADEADEAVEPEEEAPADTGTGEIAVDSRVEIIEPLNVRPSAGTSGEPQWVAEAGDQGTVISGPEEADGYVWWELVFDDGSSGFVIEDSLEIVP